MKRLTIANILRAFDERPMQIVRRLEDLGISSDEAKKYFSKDLLSTNVYASSFLKFFQENKNLFEDADKLEGEELASSYVNPFDDNPKTIGQRLSEIGMADKDQGEIFSNEVLKLNLTGDEFSVFLDDSKAKLAGKLEEIALKGK